MGLVSVSVFSLFNSYYYLSLNNHVWFLCVSKSPLYKFNLIRFKYLRTKVNVHIYWYFSSVSVIILSLFSLCWDSTYNWIISATHTNNYWAHINTYWGYTSHSELTQIHFEHTKMQEGCIMSALKYIFSWHKYIISHAKWTLTDA